MNNFIENLNFLSQEGVMYTTAFIALGIKLLILLIVSSISYEYFEKKMLTYNTSFR